MRKRTLARELAMQILYQVDVTHDASKTAIDNFWASSILKDTDESVKAFSLRLVSGVIANIEEIDKKITEYAQNWKLERMAIVDRNIMRLGCFELVYCEDIPAKVSINEAVDLRSFQAQNPANSSMLSSIRSSLRRRSEVCRFTFTHQLFRRDLHSGRISKKFFKLRALCHLYN
jgi:transcription antitermination protein NusB